jgi:formylmethanofuran dehydrogenase subunit E
MNLENFKSTKYYSIYIMMLHVLYQFKSDFSYYIDYYKRAAHRKFGIKKSSIPENIANYLINKEFLWIKIKDKKIKNGYRHFIFNQCVACDEYYYTKREIINKWCKICINNVHNKTYTKQELRDIKINSILNGR